MNKLAIAMISAVTTAGAQGAGVVVRDYRTAGAPSMHLETGRACPVVFGSPASGLPEGFSSVSNAVVLANGNVAVIDAKARSMYVFDRAGKLVRRAARPGNGPGELASVYPLVYVYRGDSMLVHDQMRRMFHIYDHDGKFGRSFIYEKADVNGRGTMDMIGTSITDGSTVWIRRRYRGMAGVETYRDSLSIVWLDATGTERAATPRLEDILIAKNVASTPLPPGPGRAVSFRTSVRSMSPGPISRSASFGTSTGAIAARGAEVAHFEEATDAIAFYNANGVLGRRILLKPLAAQLRPSEARTMPLSSAQVLEMRYDNAERLWLEVARDKIDSDRKWWVFDKDGRWVADAVTPAPREKLLDLGADYALLLRKDADDIESVAYCPIARTALTR